MKANSLFYYVNRDVITFQVAGVCYFTKNEGNKRVVYKDGHDGPDSHKRIGFGKKAQALLAAVAEFAKEHNIALSCADVAEGKKTGKHIVWTPADNAAKFAKHFQ